MAERLQPDAKLTQMTADPSGFPELDLEVFGAGDIERICAAAYVLGEADALRFEACIDWTYASRVVTTTTSIDRGPFGENIWDRTIALLSGIDADCVTALPLLRAGYYKHGIQKEAFAKTLVALDRLRSTIDQLDQMPP